MQLADHVPVVPSSDIRRKSATAIVVALILAQFASADGVTGIYVMLPSIYREFPAQPGAVSWIITTFFLVAATMAAICGRLADVLGRRNVAITLLCLSTAGALIGSMATSVSMLILASVLIGMSTTLAPILIGLAREHLGPKRLGFGIAAISAAGCAGAGLVFLLTGIVVDHFGRTGGYLAAALFAFTAAAFLAIGVPRPQRSQIRLSDIDFARGILFGPAAGGIILSVELGAADGWGNGLAPALLVGSLLLATYWWRDQLRQARPLINLRLLSHGKALRGLIAMTLLGVILQNGQVFSFLFQQPHSAGAGFGMSATNAGLMMVPINGTALLVSPAVGWMANRNGVRPVAILGATIMVLGFLICAFSFQTLGVVVAGAIICITGLSLLNPTLYLLIVEVTPTDLTSGAAGLANTLFNLGFAVGSQVVLFILIGRGSAQMASAGHYWTAFLWLAFGTAAIVAVLSVGAWRGGVQKLSPSTIAQTERRSV